MKLVIARTPAGEEILLTNEHPVCTASKIPAVAAGDGPGARGFGKEDFVPTEGGFFTASRLVIDWLESGERSQAERGLAFRFLKDAPEYL